MPITQDRMIAVLNAATEYERTFEHIRSLITLFQQEYGAVNDARAAARAANITHDSPVAPAIEAYERAIAELLSFFHDEVRVSLDAMKTIVAERAHFKATSRRNSQAAAAQRRLRASRRGYNEPSPRPSGPRPARIPVSDAERAEYDASVAFVTRIDNIRLLNGGGDACSWEQGVAIAEREDAIAVLRAADPTLTNASAANILDREAAARNRDLPPADGGGIF